MQDAPVPLPAHPLPAERSAGGQVGDGASGKFSSEGGATVGLVGFLGLR